MLQQLKALRGSQVHAIDGKVGEVHHFYFDDEAWTIRYFVVDTGSWLPNREVLISVTDATVAGTDKFAVNLTKEQVENSPDIDVMSPISRQQQIALHQYYGWPIYWIDHDPAAMSAEILATAKQAAKQASDSHLRSTREFLGFSLHGSDGVIGRVDDLLFDADAWILRYLIVEIQNSSGTRQVLIAPQWLETLAWSESKITIDLSREQIETSPAFDASEPMSRKYEEMLHEHYGVQGYWLSA